MLSKINRQNLRFQGFLNTPNLWTITSKLGLQQIQLSKSRSSFSLNTNKHLRLGKLVEHFVVHELRNTSNYELLSANYQIQDGKQTIGELDCLFLKDKQPIHLEVVYKFYLYDPSKGSTILEHWIGPNRKDSLQKKLTKLKEKQLPLLYHPLTNDHLKSFGYHASDFKQQVCFKAQLFLPYGINIDIAPLNQTCIQGFYINQDQLIDFKTCKFFIPEKLDWLMDISLHINWMSFEQFNTQLQNYFEKQTAPLCWIKYPNGETIKCFVIWW